MAEIQYAFFQKTVQDIANLYEKDLLNLEPGFQRDSVWTESDRAKLIDSIVRKYPLPSLFLYKREKDGEIVYDVIDGKQRIEAILAFMRLKWGDHFSAKVHLPGEDDPRLVDWKRLCRMQKQHLVTGYSLQTVEVDGDLADIIDLFVRINSTGKALTSAEKRHARYYRTPFLKDAGTLAAKYNDYFLRHKILSKGQISRMKDVELICELMISLGQLDVINKKTALDQVMKSESHTPKQRREARRRTVRALNQVAKMFPRLSQTRFRRVSDFYSLVVLLAKLDHEGMVLSNRRRNRLAWDLLSGFSIGVDMVRLSQKKARAAPAELESEREYLLTVTGATDHIAQRRTRERILRALLASLFERKDSKRLFSPEQRRIIWGTSDTRKCKECGEPLTWANFTVDHIKPHSKGGKTRIRNAALMCRGCNSSKGNRRR